MSNRWKVGERIQKRYEVHFIHGGGFGTVYLCYDHEGKMPVALKTPKEEHLGDKRFKDMFRQEAEAWVRLERHKNIVRAYNFIEINFRPFIAMEYIVGDDMYGVDLSGWISRGGLSLKTTLDFAVQFCLGMEHAQKKFKELGRPFVHRDVKPANILITRDRVLKVTDFGLVKALGETEKVMGTPEYMSPEQFIKGAEVDIRSDIYSFGCVLFEMLSGRQPYEIDREKYPDPHPDFEPLIYKEMHINDPIPHVMDYVSSIPEGLDGLVFRCMAKEREGRFDDFGSIRHELMNIYREHTGEGYEIEKIDDIKLEAWELVNKGASLCNLGYTDEALECYDRAIEFDPEDALAYNNRGVFYASKGYYDIGIRDFDRAIELNHEFAEAYCGRGNAYDDKGEHDLAIRDYNKAIELKPEYALAYYNRGLAYYNKGEYDLAIRDYDMAIELNPEYAEAYYNRGFAHEKKGFYKEAIRDFKKFIGLAPPQYAEVVMNVKAMIRDLEGRV